MQKWKYLIKKKNITKKQISSITDLDSYENQ